MLNELYRASCAIEKAGIRMGQEWHKHMQPFPKAKTIRLWLAKDGSIESRVDVVDDATARTLRKFMPTKFFSIPAMNVNYLTGYDGDDLEKEIGKVIKGLRLLVKQAGELKTTLDLENGSAWYELLNRLSLIDAIEFRERFERVLSQNSVGLSFTPNKPVHVVLDLADYEDFGRYPIAHQESIKMLNDVLLSTESRSEPDKSDFNPAAIDIFGCPQFGCGELVTDVTVPLLGQLSVFSLNKDIPAQERYNLSSVETCKLGKISRKRIRTALEWLTQNEKEGLTWGKLDGKSLAIAFALDIPQRKISLTRLFGSHSGADDIDAELSFENQAESVVSLLKGDGSSSKSDVALIILRKMDSKRVKIICDQVVSVEALEKRSKEWSEGFANIPDVSVREWPFVRKENRTKDGNIPQVVRAKSILPLRLHCILNEVYKQSGESVASVARFSVADDANLFLGTDSAGLAFGMIDQYMRCSRGYFLKLCRELCIKDKGLRTVTQMKWPGEHLGTLGLLLKKSNLNKENYMKETPYQLGRFLRVADELHSLYSEIVRKNDIPNEFCGSSLLLAMMEKPESALQQLAMRSNPYVKWSQTYHGENAGLVHYWRRHWSEIADQLSEGELPKHLAVAEQAQMFLGFLASFPKSRSVECESGNDKTEKENQ